VDFTLGLRQAVDTGWVELTGQGKQLRLTQSGFAHLPAVGLIKAVGYE
jgi:hypothetical protein